MNNHQTPAPLPTPGTTLAALPKVHTRLTTTPAELRHGVATGRLARILPGVYAHAALTDDPSTRRDLKIAAALATSRAGEVLSHFSAAHVWGFPSLSSDQRVHYTKQTPTARNRKGVALHAAQLTDQEVEWHNGVPITSLPRTTLDCAALLTPHAGLATLDFALRAGLTAGELSVALTLMHANSSRKLNQLLDMAVATSDSPPESMTRYWMHQAGLRDVESQVHVSAHGRNYFLDCGVRSIKLAVEYDGLVKYTDPKALYNEKLREDAIRSLRWEFIRVTTADLRNPAHLVARFRRVATMRGYAF